MQLCSPALGFISAAFYGFRYAVADQSVSLQGRRLCRWRGIDSMGWNMPSSCSCPDAPSMCASHTDAFCVFMSLPATRECLCLTQMDRFLAQKLFRC